MIILEEVAFYKKLCIVSNRNVKQLVLLMNLIAEARLLAIKVLEYT